jgi:CTP synthase (UTP-ammonia lyase)
LRTSVVSGGVLCILGSGILAAALPRFIRYDSEEGLKRKQREEALHKLAAEAG